MRTRSFGLWVTDPPRNPRWQRGVRGVGQDRERIFGRTIRPVEGRPNVVGLRWYHRRAATPRPRGRLVVRNRLGSSRFPRQFSTPISLGQYATGRYLPKVHFIRLFWPHGTRQIYTRPVSSWLAYATTATISRVIGYLQILSQSVICMFCPWTIVHIPGIVTGRTCSHNARGDSGSAMYDQLFFRSSYPCPGKCPWPQPYPGSNARLGIFTCQFCSRSTISYNATWINWRLPALRMDSQRCPCVYHYPSGWRKYTPRCYRRFGS